MRMYPSRNLSTATDMTKAVDIPGFIYQLSFAPEESFSHIFPDRNEMLSYMKRVADEYNINQHLQPNMEWVSSTWLDGRKCWSIELRSTKTGEVSIQECKVLIGAIGHQVDPKPFNVPGKSCFQGEIVQACKWSEGLDLKDKNVVVLGNGSEQWALHIWAMEKLIINRHCCTSSTKHP